MTRRVTLRSHVLTNKNKKQPLASEDSIRTPIKNSPRMMNNYAERRKVGEVAGGAAAECAAVWCCCPCAMVNLVVLAVYKVPAAVCKKAWKRSKRRRFIMKRHGLLASSGTESTVHARLREEDPTAEIVSEEKEAKGDLNELEKEMFERFYGAGFWRSPSQRDTSSGSPS